MCVHLDHRAEEVTGPREFVEVAKEHLADCPGPDQKAWDQAGQQGRKVLVELAALPLELKAKPWRELTGGEQRRVRMAAQRARELGAAFAGSGLPAGEGGE